ncbi:hypothetical protein WR25_14335 [Diploscapter pachys]|uniref:Uncharacterized protein n=1 Tax=Diploscapter pachys TaxID=2018661 RepID=A0A2A2KHB3_9BILA|nr:hypothetical protein WR25_14335 [Diploscapter pachys]
MSRTAARHRTAHRLAEDTVSILGETTPSERSQENRDKVGWHEAWRAEGVAAAAAVLSISDTVAAGQKNHRPRNSRLKLQKRSATAPRRDTSEVPISSRRILSDSDFKGLPACLPVCVKLGAL